MCPGWFFLLFVFVFLPHPQYGEVPRPGIVPIPQQWSEPQQWQHGAPTSRLPGNSKTISFQSFFLSCMHKCLYPNFMVNKWFCLLTITRNNSWLVKTARKKINWKITKMFWAKFTLRIYKYWKWCTNFTKCVLVYDSPISLSYVPQVCPFKGKEKEAQESLKHLRMPSMSDSKELGKYIMSNRHENDMATLLLKLICCYT